MSKRTFCVAGLLNRSSFAVSRRMMRKGNKTMNMLMSNCRKFYIIEHFPFSAHGLFFLSGAWMRGSFFSFSSTYSRIAAMDLDNVQRSIEAWYFKLSICLRRASLSMVANVALSIPSPIYRRGASRRRRIKTQASIVNRERSRWMAL